MSERKYTLFSYNQVDNGHIKHSLLNYQIQNHIDSLSPIFQTIAATEPEVCVEALCP
jgi:hypothetical protein